VDGHAADGEGQRWIVADVPELDNAIPGGETSVVQLDEPINDVERCFASSPAV
jgi:hypothetical protein